MKKYAGKLQTCEWLSHAALKHLRYAHLDACTQLHARSWTHTYGCMHTPGLDNNKKESILHLSKSSMEIAHMIVCAYMFSQTRVCACEWVCVHASSSVWIIIELYYTSAEWASCIVACFIPPAEGRSCVHVCARVCVCTCVRVYVCV